MLSSARHLGLAQFRLNFHSEMYKKILWYFLSVLYDSFSAEPIHFNFQFLLLKIDLTRLDVFEKAVGVDYVTWRLAYPTSCYNIFTN